MGQGKSRDGVVKEDRRNVQKGADEGTRSAQGKGQAVKDMTPLAQKAGVTFRGDSYSIIAGGAPPRGGTPPPDPKATSQSAKEQGKAADKQDKANKSGTQNAKAQEKANRVAPRTGSILPPTNAAGQSTRPLSSSWLPPGAASPVVSLNRTVGAVSAFSSETAARKYGWAGSAGIGVQGGVHAGGDWNPKDIRTDKERLQRLLKTAGINVSASEFSRLSQSEQQRLLNEARQKREKKAPKPGRRNQRSSIPPMEVGKARTQLQKDIQH